VQRKNEENAIKKKREGGKVTMGKKRGVVAHTIIYESWRL